MLMLSRAAVALAFGGLLLGGAQAQTVPVVDKKQVPAFLIEKGAEVLNVESGPGGLTVYTATKDGNPIVVYTTPDKSVAIVGVLFDAKTGANLSDAIVEKAGTLAGAGTAKPSAATAKSTGKSNSIAQHLFSDEVLGVKEGSGAAKDTAYVFFDPRCGYCHSLYKNTRTVASQGVSIKWIPVNTLGAAGVPVSAAVLRGGLPALSLMARNALPGETPTAMERERIEINTRYLTDITAQVGKQPATPTIVFQAPNGKFSVVQDDGSDKAAFAAAFRVKK